MEKENENAEAADDHLFHREVADSTPHESDKIPLYKPRLKPVPLPPNPPVTGERREERFADLAVETGEELLFVRPGVQRRLMAELKRGRLPPEELLDLHGLRVAEARVALGEFLDHARRHRLRVVQIIHGKGSGSEERQPVLKQKVDQWLRQCPEVLAYCSAPRFDGGTGAVYLLLSRKGKQTGSRHHPWR